jgi:hypothetical protein
MENFKALKEMIAATEHDAEAFFKKGNNAAGTRLRNAMLKIKAAASDLRKEVTDKKKS